MVFSGRGKVSVKNGRIKIEAIGPDDSAALRIHTYPFEEPGIFELLENRALTVPPDEFKLPDKTIAENSA